MRWSASTPAQCWQLFSQTPLPEIIRRVSLLAEFENCAETEVDGARRFGWEDGGGQFAVWYFLSDGRAMLLTSDHELQLNVLGGPEEYAVQTSFFDGVPADLVALVTDRPEHDETFNIEGPDGHTIETAGGVFFFDGQRWQISPGVLAYLADGQPVDSTTVDDVLFESGFTTCLESYCFGEEFTVDAIMREYYPYVLEPDEERAQRERLAEILADPLA